jgi:hypothetical protein
MKERSPLRLSELNKPVSPTVATNSIEQNVRDIERRRSPPKQNSQTTSPTVNRYDRNPSFFDKVSESATKMLYSGSSAGSSPIAPLRPVYTADQTETEPTFRNPAFK